MAKPNVFGPLSSQARIESGHAGDGVKTHPVGANQTIKRGDVLVWGSGGLLEQAIALPGSDGTGSSPGSLVPVAIALAPITTGASPDADTDRIPALMLAAGTGRGEWTRIYNAVAADAEQQDVSIGTLYRLGRWRVTSTVSFYYMTTNAAAGDVRCLAKSPESAKGDDYGVVLIGL